MYKEGDLYIRLLSAIQWSMHDYSCNNYLGLRLQNFREQMDCMINHNGVDMVLNDALCNDSSISPNILNNICSLYLD